jgi:hypothetical protein
MGLLEVVTSNAGAKADLKTKVKASEGRSQPASTDRAAVETVPTGVATTSVAGTPPAPSGGEADTVTSMVDSPQSYVHTEASRPDVSGDASDPSDEEVGPSTLGSGHKFNASAILANLPEPELRNLCKLLAQEG